VLDPLGSTSWPNRHLAYFKNLDELLRGEGVTDPLVEIVGPGGVTRLTAPFLNDAARPSPSRLRTLIGDAARYSDQVLRRISVMPLLSLEPAELDSALSMPHRLLVVDRSQRVLAAVARDLPHAECHCVDISFQPLPATADVVVAFNVVCRLEDPKGGMARIAGAVRPGGWLLIDDRSAAAQLGAWPDFVPVAPKTHRRRPATSG
jgi:SAM-dependent methyltransferase